MGTGRLKVAASVTLALGMLAAFGANYRIDEKGNVHSVRTIAERVPIIAPVAPGVLRARPTFNSCGVCFGSVQAVEGLALEYQTKGDRQWKVCREFPHFDESGDYRGSLMYLREDTAYVCRIVVKGKEIARTSFRTWASDVPIARTVVIDPAKVTRVALENAASVAGMFLTTECVIVDHPEEHPAPAMPAGGMGGMM